MPPDSLVLGSGAVVSVWTPADPTGVVVLQHGYAEHVARMLTQHHQLVAHLLEAGNQVWGMDLLGHGRSPGRRAVTDVHRAVADHQQVRRRAAAGGLPLAVVGHSLGGLVSAGSVAADPSSVEGVVLLAPALPDDPGPAARLAARALARVVPGLGLGWMHEPISSASRVPGHEARTRADPLMHLGPLTALTGATALGVAADLWPRLPDWQVPTLVLHGTADRHTDPAGSRRFVDAIAAPDRELVELADGRHELLDDLERDAVLERIMTWLAERLAT